MEIITLKKIIGDIIGIKDTILIIDKISANKLILGGAEIHAIIRNIQIIVDKGSNPKIPLLTNKLRLNERE